MYHKCFELSNLGSPPHTLHLELGIEFHNILILIRVLGTTTGLKLHMRDMDSAYPVVFSTHQVLVYTWNSIPYLSDSFKERLSCKHRYDLFISGLYCHHCV